MDRRHFFTKIFTRIFYFFSGMVLAYPAFSFITFKKSTKKIIIFPKEEQQSRVTFKDGVYLKREGGEFVALSARCTHLGCLLSYDQLSQRFLCPCHGSIFDRKGKRISGPAKRDLQRIPITIKENGDISAIVAL